MTIGGNPLLQLVSNPGSGNHDGAKLRAIAAALERQGFRVELAKSSANEVFVPDPEASHICVAGGDGTVRHVAQAVAALDPLPGFSVFPMGTINLVAREWLAPRDPEAFARHVAQQGETRHFSPVRIKDTVFVACASIGPDADAVALVSERLKARIGRIAYGVSLAKVLLRWTPPQLDLRIDGKCHQCEALYIANGRYYAGPWVVAPDAGLDRPGLQVVILKKAGRLRFLLFLLAVMFGQTGRMKSLIMVDASELEISADRPVRVQLDGDDGTSLPATVKMIDVRFNEG